jgi:hypothetical protein
MRIILWLGFILALAACDTKAPASDPQGGVGPRAEQKGRDRELRGHAPLRREPGGLTIVSPNALRRRRLPRGRRGTALGRGEAETAIAAYAQAIGQYEAEKVPGGVPAEIDCAYGAALAAGKGKKENAELAARVLHRCVLAVPVGSSLRFQAFEHLATLEGAGLDPLLLGGSKTADLYLTKAAARPASEKLVVTVAATPEPKKSFAAIRDKITSTDVRGPLIACWDANYAATKKEAMT